VVELMQREHLLDLAKPLTGRHTEARVRRIAGA
jgi:hypothetical protein